MDRPSDRAVAQAFWELRDPDRPIGEQWPLNGIEQHAREIDAAAPAVVVSDEMVERALQAFYEEPMSVYDAKHMKWMRDALTDALQVTPD